MYYNANLSVNINGHPLTTVVAVKTSNDGQKVGGEADVVVPLNSYIQYSNPNDLTTYLTSVRSDTFPQGTPITITASYDGLPTIQVFNGFIYDFVLGMPMTIKCMDYIYFFNLGIFGDKRVTTTNKAKTKVTHSGIGINYKSVKFQDLLQQLVDFVNETINSSLTGAQQISLILPIFDMELVNLTFISMSPASILEWLKKELGLNISLFGNKLFVNLASTTTGLVKLSTGIHVIESKLQTPLATFQRIRMKCWFIREDGTRDSVEVGDQNGNQEEHFFYKVVRNGNNYETLANAALLKSKQHHFNGELGLLLYPDCDLFWRVEYTDLRYPEKNGTYVITGVYFELNEKGFHRKLKLAWLTPPD